MRAVVIENPGPDAKLAIEVRPDPTAGRGQVVVRTAFVGVNRADVIQAAGRYPAPPGVVPDIPGLEYAGVVESIASDVTNLKPGDRVFGLVGGGAYAERIELRQDGRIVGQHPRVFGRGQTVYDPWHYVPVLARKPGALRNGAPFQDWVLPGALERVRRKLRAALDGDRQMVEVLGAVLTDGLPAVEAACAEALKEGVHSADVILNILSRRRDHLGGVGADPGQALGRRAGDGGAEAPIEGAEGVARSRTAAGVGEVVGGPGRLRGAQRPHVMASSAISSCGRPSRYSATSCSTASQITAGAAPAYGGSSARSRPNP